MWFQEHGGWTVADHHLATIAMELNSVYRQSLAAAGMKERELPPPLRIQRPGPKPARNHWIKTWASAATGRR